ncbi:hypothetical protein ACFVRB_42970 [Streptomyces nojiriensis]|uniref:hypothetical protein n=1 Tax=Streptomyces nojiriensis TaxID=66374 RepID=UPI0036DC3EE1
MSAKRPFLPVPLDALLAAMAGQPTATVADTPVAALRAAGTLERIAAGSAGRPGGVL